MTDELKAYIDNLYRVTAEREKVAAELSVAPKIQLGALSQLDFLTNRKAFQIYASMDAAKGIPEAFYMMRAKTTLKNLVLMAKKHAMLGVNEEEVYGSHRLVLQPGELIFLYTDGVTEAMNEAGKIYSEERLEKRLVDRGKKMCRKSSPRFGRMWEFMLARRSNPMTLPCWA